MLANGLPFATSGKFGNTLSFLPNYSR
jgi:hypothetical protein